MLIEDFLGLGLDVEVEVTRYLPGAGPGNGRSGSADWCDPGHEAEVGYNILSTAWADPNADNDGEELLVEQNSVALDRRVIAELENGEEG